MSGLTTESTEAARFFFLPGSHPRLKVWQHRRTGDFVRIVNCDSIDGACLIVEKCDAIGDIGQELYTCEQSDLVEITKQSWEAVFPNDGVNLTYEEASK